MKKKLWTGILAAVLTFPIGSTNALAAEPQYPGCLGHYNTDGTWVSFVDENGDGICDNFASGACGGRYGCSAKRLSGLNRGRGLRNSQCLWHAAADGNWGRCVDTDGNGVCDTCGTAIPLRAGFIDEDNDGICDNFSSDTCRGGFCGGTGRQGGGRGGRRG